MDANFGHYQMHIGPEYSIAECRRQHMPLHSRPIDIAARIDHLYVEPHRITPMPTREVIDHHLKATVIIHDVTVQIFDADGDGEMIRIEPQTCGTISIKHTTNLAGDEGMERLNTLRDSGKLAQETYRIIQDDVLRLLRHHQAQTTHRAIS